MKGDAARRRMTGAALALLLQALFIAALVLSLRPVVAPENLTHELTWILPRLREAAPAPAKRAPSPEQGTASAVPPAKSAAPPSAGSIPVPLAPSPQQLGGVGQSLFGCTPENWSSLTAQQRAHCAAPNSGVAVQDAPYLLHLPDHVKDEDHWAAELKKRDSPFAIPCTHTKVADLGHGLEIPMVMFDTTTCGHTPPDPPPSPLIDQ
jgi:hypothetical protein